MKRITIYDTTLRDGMQGVGVNYSLRDKLLITEKLDDIGIDYIEGGFPLASDKEAAFFSEAQKLRLKHARICAFGSTRKPGKKTDQDPHMQALLAAETPSVTLVGKAWIDHVSQVLETTPEENLAMIFDSIQYLVSRGKEVIFDLEHFFDGYKQNKAYTLEVLQAASQAGSSCLVLCDTNGGCLFNEVTEILHELPQDLAAPFGVHFHDDTGMAVANSLAGVLAGATHVQGTVNGWGERCGNMNLCTFIPDLVLKTTYKTGVNNHLEKLTTLSRFVAEIANIIPDKRQPYVGEAAFSHKAGQHADVIAKAPSLMEHIDASQVGNRRKIILSELAGKSTIIKKLSRYGRFDKDSQVVSSLITTLKERETAGYEYEAAEASFDILVRKSLDLYTPLLELNNYHLESYKTWEIPSKTIGRIFLQSHGKQIMGAGVGIGPVETLDAALRDALTPFHSFIKNISLTDYKVRVLEPERAAAAKVRVFITSTDHTRSWDTVGVNQNIIEASWEAIIDSFEYYYNNFVLIGGDQSINQDK
ncbi:MAG: citramalate synthase [Spirochaetales bacterium]|nr:citramalate synthase [Spirochaetales bacterium]